MKISIITKFFLSILVILLVSCSQTENRIVLQSQEIISTKEQEEMPPIENNTLANKDILEIEIENNTEILENAAIKLHSFLKLGRIAALQRNQEMFISLEKQNDGRIKMILSEQLNAPQSIDKSEFLPGQITISETHRHFRYDKNGNIDFDEPDKIFLPLENSPAADLILFFLDPKISTRGMLDIVKEKAQVYIHIVE